MKVKKLSLIMSLSLLLSSIPVFSFADEKIDFVYGSNRYETSSKISQKVFKNSDYIIVANGKQFADALTGGQLSIALNAPTLLVESNYVPSSVKNEIKKLNPKKIYILGGTSSVDNNVENELSSIAKTERLGGSNRYETSNIIMSETKKITNADNLIVVNGKNFPDALSASGLMMKNKSLLALSDGYKMPEFKGNITVIGGNSSLPLPGYNGKRISGSNRYETSFLINKECNEESITLASGENFPDALSAISLSYNKKAPIFLVGKTIDNEELKFLDKKKHIYVVGGPNSISNSIIDKLKNKEEIKPSLSTQELLKKNESSIKDELYKLVNDYRTKNGKTSLVINTLANSGSQTLIKELNSIKDGKRSDGKDLMSIYDYGNLSTYRGQNIITLPLSELEKSPKEVAKKFYDVFLTAYEGFKNNMINPNFKSHNIYLGITKYENKDVLVCIDTFFGENDNKLNPNDKLDSNDKNNLNDKNSKNEVKKPSIKPEDMEEYNRLIKNGLSPYEAELAVLINEYREEKGLPRLKISKSLTEVARIHTKDQISHPDLDKQVDSRGIKGNLHSWSYGSDKWKGVIYTPDHVYADLVWSKPSELTNYKGKGYEISCVMHNGKITPDIALNLWKKSPAHNGTIIGEGYWNRLNTFGVGIENGYANVWWGNEEDPDGYY